ncbi:zinc finger (C3HC4 RING finger) protein, putative [Eimeria tenella]|uniref:Zinc finger (C3HC4 RING finger) protein, putative n=1 Tax=Eimeria tenella TaxID=5802 RepID=U6KXU3_EIMTE|nr:zinc finger (C3HC4 RING finger) protein, putative [Eimeria tenella]CDJ40315.1 zinc finger (C3HC4 RING finger) protein, putative [Eimeria tenella]|eukprot:XP_013231068.1 zinc finger (C3HC4 RING finger) protein, putative [Eimeria tenella]
MQPQAPSISVNRCCPICMVELADEDVVLVMPCDSSPICRANIVHLITGAAGPSQGERGVEMQV